MSATPSSAVVDPISHVFSLLKVDHRYPARLDARGDWSLHFPGSSHVRFGASVRGSCWLKVAGEPEPLRIDEGDGYLLTRGQVYTVASDLSLAPIDGAALFRAHDSYVRHGPAHGARVSLVSGRFTFDELSTEVLLSVLPPMVVMRASDESSEVLRAAIDMLDYETRERRFGASFVTHHVAQIMLVHALRRLATAADHAPLGWLAALANPHIGAALRLMHSQSDRRWTVGELAAVAGMSRSIFALRFKELTGSAPLDYLLHLRMRKAGLALRTGSSNIASIAYDIGYRSESAFSNAFKRVMGESPKAFRARPANAAPESQAVTA